MCLSTYENKLDKKGRVSVPASYRSYLSNLGYNGVICYPSFNNQSIEAWPQDRIEKISYSIESLNPFDEKIDESYHLKSIIKAFQRRFRQELINGIIDKECLLISKNLIEKYY